MCACACVRMFGGVSYHHVAVIKCTNKATLGRASLFWLTVFQKDLVHRRRDDIVTDRQGIGMSRRLDDHLCSGLRERTRNGAGYKACVTCVRVYHVHELYLFCMCFVQCVCVVCAFYVSDMHMYKYTVVGKFGLIKTVAGKGKRRSQPPHAMSSINIWDLARNLSNKNKMGGRRHSLTLLSWCTEWM